MEPKDAKSLRCEKFIPPPVTLQMPRFKVLSTVDLYNQVTAVTNEVGNVRANRCLPAEACAVQPMRAERAPHDALRIR
jgi:hypothetical protein